MTDAAPDLTKLVYSKTETGQQEIQSRSLGLPLKVRGALVLVDGRRTGAELAALTGVDIVPVLEQLMAQGCIESHAPPRQSRSEAATEAEPEPDKADLSSLPPAASRDAKQIDMARNFMMNTVNSVFGHHMRLTLISSIYDCKTADALRQIYPVWEEAMAGNRAGAKRLPEMREKLFAVL